MTDCHPQWKVERLPQDGWYYGVCTKCEGRQCRGRWPSFINTFRDNTVKSERRGKKKQKFGKFEKFEEKKCELWATISQKA